jgi:hypothetical protein
VLAARGEDSPPAASSISAGGITMKAAAARTTSLLIVFTSRAFRELRGNPRRASSYALVLER